MDYADQVTAWQALNTTRGGSAAALIGLLFVGISLHLPTIVANPEHSARPRGVRRLAQPAGPLDPPAHSRSGTLGSGGQAARGRARAGALGEVLRQGSGETQPHSGKGT